MAAAARAYARASVVPAIAKPKRRNVAVLLFRQFAVLDVFGPMEALTIARSGKDPAPEAKHHWTDRWPSNALYDFKSFAVGGIAGGPGSITSASGVKAIAKYSLTDIERLKPDILLIPGLPDVSVLGANSKFVDAMRRASAASHVTATICTGSILFAATGLLDGKPATTNKMAFDIAQKFRPAVKWQCSARWVSLLRPAPSTPSGSPKVTGIITSSGLSAGTDMTFGLLAALHGEAVAKDAAHTMEHVWDPNPNDDPFSVC